MKHPDRNDAKYAKSADLATYLARSADKMAVGPTVTSLQLPNSMYMRPGKMLEYSPTWKQPIRMYLYKRRFGSQIRLFENRS